jgi:hypothetical protein
MVESLLQIAQAEEQTLLEELRSVPAFVKLQAVRALISAYGEAPQPKIVQFQARSQSSSRGRAVFVSHNKEDSRAATLMAATLKFLQQHGKRAPTREIMQALKAEGVSFDGDNAMNALASTLSRSPQLNNIRGHGFGLVEWPEPDVGSTLAPAYPSPRVNPYAPAPEMPAPELPYPHGNDPLPDSTNPQ